MRNLKNEGKNAVFLGACAKRAAFMRVGRLIALPSDLATRDILRDSRTIQENYEWPQHGREETSKHRQPP